MPMVQIPNNLRYWTPIVGNTLIQETMPLNKFDKIKPMLHFNNNNEIKPRDDPNNGRHFKIRPVVEQYFKSDYSILM